MFTTELEELPLHFEHLRVRHVKLLDRIKWGIFLRVDTTVDEDIAVAKAAASVGESVDVQVRQIAPLIICD